MSSQPAQTRWGVPFSVEPVNRLGFTMVELVTVIAIILILMSLLLGALSNGRQLAKRVTCANNIKQVQIGMTLYQGDFEDYFPWGTMPGGQVFWHQLLAEEMDYFPPWADGNEFNWESPVWCPVAQNRHLLIQFGTASARRNVSYSMPIYKNGYGTPIGGATNLNPAGGPRRLSDIKIPSDVMALLEGGTGIVGGGSIGGIFYWARDGSATFPSVSSYADGIGRHGGPGRGTNMLFADGHVAYFGDGDALFDQWRGPGQKEFPFNVDLK